MSLHVKIDVNSKNIGTLHIGRLDELYSNTQVSEYVAWVGEFSERKTALNAAKFDHQYDDGALVCIRKAIEALEAKGIRI